MSIPTQYPTSFNAYTIAADEVDDYRAKARNEVFMKDDSVTAQDIEKKVKEFIGNRAIRNDELLCENEYRSGDLFWWEDDSKHILYNVERVVRARTECRGVDKSYYLSVIQLVEPDRNVYPDAEQWVYPSSKQEAETCRRYQCATLSEALAMFRFARLEAMRADGYTQPELML